MKQKFKIIDYDPKWKEVYLIEKNKLVSILGDSLISIHHIGSTAILHTKAKPEIDILVVVKDSSILSSYDNLFKKLGYDIRGECLENRGTPGRFYYSKDVNNTRTHKLHICQIGHPEIMTKLLFVKYLNEHRDSAIDYGDLKDKLSRSYNYGAGIEKYLEGKAHFILDIIQKAQDKYDGITYDYFC